MKMHAADECSHVFFRVVRAFHSPAPVLPLLQCESIGYPPELSTLVDKIVARTGIDNRFTCVGTDGSKYMAALEAPMGRSSRWEEWAPKMAVQAAREALKAWPAGSAADVTHVVVHSCTGFAAPGLDFHLIQELQLHTDVRKMGVNFMGCFGAFTSLYVAKQIIEADGSGEAVVLVVCSETCTVHMTREQQVELIVGQALFGDGAGAAIVTHAGFTGRGKTGSSAPRNEWAIGDMSSAIVPNSAGAMTWKTGEAPGQYAMWLDKAIPSLLSGMFATQGLSLTSKVGISSAWNCAWAIHPGGKAILKAFGDAFSTLRIKGEGLEISAEVLRSFGNMSSPTILFVLQRLLAATARDEVFVAGFGPGLTIEFGRLYRVRSGEAGKEGAGNDVTATTSNEGARGNTDTGSAADSSERALASSGGSPIPDPTNVLPSPRGGAQVLKSGVIG